MSKIFFLLCIFYFVSINANELKSLKESFNNIENEGDKSLLLMQRCAAIYGALSVMPPIEMNPEELKTRYKIFIQSALNHEMDNKKISDEEQSYKNQLEIFKSSIVLFIQIFKQNYKKNNSFFQNTWVENDYEMCEKL